MTIRASQSVTRVFTTRRFDTGAATNADSLPTGTLYVNGTADAATVTVTNITTGVYKAAVTMPSGLVVGDVVDLRINATVNSVADNAVIWQDMVDVAINSSGAITVGTNNDKTGYSLTQAFPSNFAALAITAGGAVTAGTVSDKTGYALSSSGLSSVTTWTVAITGNITGNLSGSVGSVTGNVGGSVASVVGNVGGNVTGSVGSISGVMFPSNFGALAIAAITGAVTVGTNNDKTGYSLTQAFPSNFSSLAITAGGSVTAGTVSDKIGYALSTAGVSTITGGVWDALLSAHTTAGTFGARVLRSSNSQNEVQVTGSNHIAADVHETQPGSIHAVTFDANAIDAAALASDAASEIAASVRTNLTTELGRIDAAVSTRLATSGYTAPPSAATVADTVLGRSMLNVQDTAAEHSLCTLVLGATESAVSGATWTIYQTDGTTTYRTKTITTSATADPITAVT